MKLPSGTDTLPLRQHLATLARYNLWATRRLFEQVDGLSDADYRRDAGLFFKSVHGTLNHLLVAEHLLWLRRFSGGESPRVALNDEVETDRVRLRERLTESAHAWQPFIDTCDPARFGSMMDYTTTKGVAMSLPFAATLAHVFNHATHHRGQITAAITMMGHPCPEIDLVWMLQAERRSS
ncbi:MAG: damage-inducible protein DinB [Methylibium sp. NZG]|nr:MAG: damage-inducible protein DinB [Methylibium sp. NZG]